MGHVESKIRSQGQMLEKPCVCSWDQIFGLILMKFGQTVCLDEILYMFKHGSYWLKSRSLGQIIEDPVLVSKGCYLNPCSLMLYHTIWKAQASDSRAIMALLFHLELKFTIQYRQMNIGTYIQCSYWYFSFTTKNSSE